LAVVRLAVDFLRVAFLAAAGATSCPLAL
jgi:hypothetical protein